MIIKTDVMNTNLTDVMTFFDNSIIIGITTPIVISITNITDCTLISPRYTNVFLINISPIVNNKWWKFICYLYLCAYWNELILQNL